MDLSNEEQSSVPQLLVDFDRPAMARHGLTPASLARSVEALFQGTDAGEILKEGLVSRVAVAFPEDARRHREQLEALPVTTPDGNLVRLGEVARVRFDLGASLVRREDVQRLRGADREHRGGRHHGRGGPRRRGPAELASSSPPGTASPSAASSRRGPAASGTSPCSGA